MKQPLSKIEKELTRAGRAWLSGGSNQTVRDNRENRLAVALEDWLRARGEYGQKSEEKAE